MEEVEEKICWRVEQMTEGELQKRIKQATYEKTIGYKDAELQGINVRVPIKESWILVENLFYILEEMKKEFPKFEIIRRDDDGTAIVQRHPKTFSPLAIAWFKKWLGEKEEK